MEQLQNKTALIVDSSEENRTALRNLLQGDLRIQEAESAETAIALFKDADNTIDILLLDIPFPTHVNFSVLSYLKDSNVLPDMPVIVISEDGSDAFVEAVFDLGAIDCIQRPFSNRLLVRRVLTTLVLFKSKKDLAQKIDRRHMESFGQEIDGVTGLYTKRMFLEQASKYLEQNKDNPLCILAIDIDHFLLFNQCYGSDAATRYLVCMAEYLKRYSAKFGGVTGFTDDNRFFYLCPDKAELFNDIRTHVRSELSAHSLEIGFAPKFGVYCISPSDKKSILNMCDCAISAIAHGKREYSHLIVWYDDSMEQCDDESKLLQDIEVGLQNKEFTCFLQPKCNMSTKKIVGAEALVRWIRRDGSMVSPAVFIPVLEKNGFTSRVDAMVWEEVCRYQRECIDRALPLLPVSINVSRSDIYNMDVCDHLLKLLRKYELPISCLELEITESVLVSEYHSIEKEIAKIKEHGFTTLMDDFGSGYSAMNVLRDLDIDILKLDLKFLKLDYNAKERSDGILESIISSATTLNIPIIVEGVELANQVDFLLGLGCRYAQGYYFYRPLKKSDYTALLENAALVDLEGVHPATVENVHLLSVAEEKSLNDEVINNILGAVAFYEVEGESVRLVKLNQRYYHMMGIDNSITDPEYAVNLRKYIHPDDYDKFFSLFGKASADAANGASADIRCVKKDGGIQWVRIRVFAMNSQSKAKLYYGSLEDLSELYKAQ